MKSEKSHSAYSARVYMVETQGSGGICQYTHDLCENMQRAGCDVVLLTTFDYELSRIPRSFEVRGILFSYPRHKKDGPHHKAVRLLKHLWNFAALTGYLMTRRNSVIHYQRFLSRFFVPHLMLVKLFQGRVVYTAHDAFSHDEDPGWVGRFKKIYGVVDKIIVLASYSRDLIAGRFPELAEKLSVVPHGNFDYLAKDGQGRILEDRRVILFFGHVRKYKGLEVLLMAFNKVAARVHDAHLLVVGNLAEKGKTLSDYEDILEPHARARATFVPGYIEIDDVPKYFRSSDIVALPYISATQSGVAQLAYSFGKPVIASRVGGLPEQVDDGKSGCLVAPNDPSGLADAICGMLGDPSKVASMGEYARRLSETRFGWRNIAALTLEVYGTLYASGGMVMAERIKKVI